jgi:hypothetical protein
MAFVDEYQIVLRLKSEKYSVDGSACWPRDLQASEVKVSPYPLKDDELEHDRSRGEGLLSGMLTIYNTYVFWVSGRLLHK